MGEEKEGYNLISIKNQHNDNSNSLRKIRDDNVELIGKIDELKAMMKNDVRFSNDNHSINNSDNGGDNNHNANFDKNYVIFQAKDTNTSYQGKKNDFLNSLKELHQEKNNKISEIHKTLNDRKNHHLNNNLKLNLLIKKVSDNQATISDLKKVILLQKKEIQEIEDKKNKDLLDNSELKGYYKTKLKGLADEVNDKRKIVASTKSVIMQQKEELEDKNKIISQLKAELDARKAMHHPEKLLKALEEKHGLIVNLHNITKELSSHYLSKVSEYKDVTAQAKSMNLVLKKDLEYSMLKNGKVVNTLRGELEQNQKVLTEFKKLAKELDTEVIKRENLIKELYEQNQVISNELSDTKTKAEMYERISLKSKNDAFTYHEKYEEALLEFEKYKEENDGLNKLVPKLTQEITNTKKQLITLKEEYEARVERIKQKHENELKEFFSNQTKNDMVLKTQIYSLNQNVQDLENQLTAQKQQQQFIASELNDKLKSLMNSDVPIITNIPRTINDDY